MQLRYSFVSLDRASSPDGIVVGEYSTDAGDPGRVARFPVDYTDRLPLAEPDGRTYGSEAYDTHLLQMQGALARDGRFWLASSNGSNPCYLRVWDRPPPPSARTPGRSARRTCPMGGPPTSQT